MNEGADPPYPKAPSFAVAIPMFNEEAGAEKCVRAVCAVLDRLPLRCSLIAVDDGSADGTAGILRRLEPEFPSLHVVQHSKNRGYGAALRTAMATAAQQGYEYVLFMDSDLTNDPADIPRFVEEMRRGVDVIKASRFGGGGRMVGVPLRRSLVSRIGNLVAEFMFGCGIKDCTNGFRAVRVSILQQLNLSENGFPIIVEELYQARFLAKSYAEVPVVLTNRTDDLRPTSFSYKPATFYRYFVYGLKAMLGIRPATGE